MRSHSARDSKRHAARHPPSRPLFLPIVFSLGAKIENTPAPRLSHQPHENHERPTPNPHPPPLRRRSLLFRPQPRSRSPRRHIAMAQQDDQPPTLHWPHRSENRRTPENLRSPEDAAKHPRVTVAVEVIQRLKSLLRDEPLLLAGVTGPFTLAAQLTRSAPADSLTTRRFLRRRGGISRRHHHPDRHQTGGSWRQRNLHPRRNFPNASAATPRSLGLNASPSLQHHPLLRSAPRSPVQRPDFLRRE